jgi:hypothetical protein
MFWEHLCVPRNDRDLHIDGRVLIHRLHYRSLLLIINTGTPRPMLQLCSSGLIHRILNGSSLFASHELVTTEVKHC